jgi:hypothetical protein
VLTGVQVAVLLCGGPHTMAPAGPHRSEGSEGPGSTTTTTTSQMDLLSTLAGLLKNGANRGLEPLLHTQCLRLLLALVQASSSPSQPLAGVTATSQGPGTSQAAAAALPELSPKLATSIAKCAAAAIRSTDPEVQSLGAQLVQALLTLRNVGRGMLTQAALPGTWLAHCSFSLPTQAWSFVIVLLGSMHCCNLWSSALSCRGVLMRWHALS